jgi:calcium/calmodulin-dependent protein kinase I
MGNCTSPQTPSTSEMGAKHPKHTSDSVTNAGAGAAGNNNKSTPTSATITTTTTTSTTTNNHGQQNIQQKNNNNQPTNTPNKQTTTSSGIVMPTNSGGMKAGDESAFKKKYQLKGVLGNGNYSVVRKAIDLTNGEQVAVKCVDKRKLTKEDDDALRIEVSILSQLSHPNIIRLFDWYDVPKAYFYVVLEFMSGGELFDRIVKKEFYSEADAQKVVRTLADCIKYLHDRKVVHRDLKPENILLKDSKDDSAIKIADFGFARVVDRGLTTACGTPGYVAPEIINGKPYGLTVDVWSLGVIIYILLCGYPPFYNQNQNQLFKQIREGRFVFDSPYWDPISEQAKDLIKLALTVDVHKRPNIQTIIQHPWLTSAAPQKDISGQTLAEMRKFNARRKLRAGIRAALAANRLKEMAEMMASAAGGGGGNGEGGGAGGSGDT